MSRRGTIQVDGVTYYHEQLWEALVQQNLEMGMEQNRYRGRENELCSERDAVRRQADDLGKELDFALQQLDDAVKRVEAFQRTQRQMND